MQITQALSSLATGFKLANMPRMVNAGGGAGLAGRAGHHSGLILRVWPIKRRQPSSLTLSGKPERGFPLRKSGKRGATCSPPHKGEGKGGVVPSHGFPSPPLRSGRE